MSLKIHSLECRCRGCRKADKVARAKFWRALFAAYAGAGALVAWMIWGPAL